MLFYKVTIKTYCKIKCNFKVKNKNNNCALSYYTSATERTLYKDPKVKYKVQSAPFIH